MIFGMTTFTYIHVLLSLIGILTGLVVLYGLVGSRRMNGWTLAFLVTTVATSVTGYLFPFHGVTPAIVVGALSLIALAAVIAGWYAFHLAGAWRLIYVVGVVTALYFNVFVLVVQSFLKIPALHALAPTTPPSGPAFLASQAIVLTFFVVMGVLAVRRFHPAAV
jgi:hypothetical protein